MSESIRLRPKTMDRLLEEEDCGREALLNKFQNSVAAHTFEVETVSTSVQVASPAVSINDPSQHQ